jgi:hypothetical protein
LQFALTLTSAQRCALLPTLRANGASMAQPPLYKYLSNEGAKLTLKNKCFRHAKPSYFNDTEDFTVRSIFPEDDDAAFKQLEEGFVDCLVKHLDDNPTSTNLQIRTKVRQLQGIFKANPDAANLIKEAMKKGGSPPIIDREQMKKRNREFVAEINLFMQNWRVLCVSTLNNSDEMWVRYADDHQGIVLRIVPNLEKDSKFQRFAPVVYREKRPSLYESAASFQEDSLFGDQQARFKKSLDMIIYSKTLNWQNESEYRLAIPLGHGERDWNTLSYHSDEIAELYLGAKMTTESKTEIIGLAQAVNPNIKIFEMFHDANGELQPRPH